MGAKYGSVNNLHTSTAIIQKGIDMIIWGSKGKTKVIGRGQFYCPKCKALRSYEHHQIGKYFTLYFIPLFQTRKLGEYIECKFCHIPFETSVLEYDHQLHDQIQKGIDTISKELDAGIPINLIYQNMIRDGVSKDMANNIIAMATGGKLKVCKNCNLVFTGTFKYCANCGQVLVSP